MEKTLVLIKPDAVERNLIGEIISMYEKEDLVISDIKKIRATEEIARKHYYNKLSEKPTPSGVGWIASPVGTIAKAIIAGDVIFFNMLCIKLLTAYT